jgi:glycosyltransferase involved in cell wall biosynthesis
MPSSKDICVLIDETVLGVHHGVRRYLLSMCATLKAQGQQVYLVDGTDPSRYEIVVLNDGLLLNNGFTGNRLVGSTRSEILRHVRAGCTDELKRSSTMSSLHREPADTLPSCFELCIVGAPWIMTPNLRLPKADRYVCVAYDAIPNLYYFNNPQDYSLRLFAHAHYRGYRWADEEASGIFCISALTALQCQMLGFGKRNGLRVLPPMIPPGFLTLDETRIRRKRGRVALLAAPFDRRKGLLAVPQLVNSGGFDSLLIFGRPRCSHEDTVAFFEQLEIENIQWWCDVDFEKQVELYTSAKVLLFPSLNEGLGFPVLEAYACGTSVLTTNIEPLNQLVHIEDLLATDAETCVEQVRHRADAEIEPMKYRQFVDNLCAVTNLGLIQEDLQ